VAQRVVAIRHGETEWTASHRHTGRTDIPLNPHGEQRARLLGPLLDALDDMDGWCLDRATVFTSPLQRARRTCELAGLGATAAVLDDLVEWDYGEFEGTKTSELRAADPSWSIWTAEITQGESLADVGARADRVIDLLDGIDGCVVLFAHAHFLRIFGARWCGWPPDGGRHFTLGPASISVLGYERETKVVEGWNRSPHV
jgi:probable phosphoglycerate mutase